LDIGCGSGCGFWKLWNIGCGCECGWRHPSPHPISTIFRVLVTVCDEQKKGVKIKKNHSFKKKIIKTHFKHVSKINVLLVIM
jgi:hypothetical protein